MLTRKDVFRGYTIDADGVIQNLGKFEGEMLYAPYYYDAMLNGDGDLDDEDVTWFVIEDVDRTEFPELGKATHVSLYESDQGFVYVNTHDRASRDRNADRIDGYDRDDLGESSDY